MKMKSVVGLSAIVIALSLSSVANAHSLRVQCKKLSDDNVVCRFLFTNGGIARNMPVQLVDEDSDKVLASSRTDAQGMFAFKPPGAEYNVVIEANKGHVASISSDFDVGVAEVRHPGVAQSIASRRSWRRPALVGRP